MTSGSDSEARRRDAERLAGLEAALAARSTPAETRPGLAGESFNQANLAWRMVIELVSGLVIGLVIGYGLDQLLGTMPVLLIVFVLAGLAAGIRTMLRTAREVGGQGGGTGNGTAQGASVQPPQGGLAGQAPRDDSNASPMGDDDEDEDR